MSDSSMRKKFLAIDQARKLLAGIPYATQRERMRILDHVANLFTMPPGSILAYRDKDKWCIAVQRSGIDYLSGKSPTLLIKTRSRQENGHWIVEATGDGQLRQSSAPTSESVATVETHAIRRLVLFLMGLSFLDEWTAPAFYDRAKTYREWIWETLSGLEDKERTARVGHLAVIAGIEKPEAVEDTILIDWLEKQQSPNLAAMLADLERGPDNVALLKNRLKGGDHGRT